MSIDSSVSSHPSQSSSPVRSAQTAQTAQAAQAAQAVQAVQAVEVSSLARDARDTRDVSRTDSALDALLDLFESELSDVVFPDLGVATLREADAVVEARRQALAEAEAALAESMRALDTARQAFERVGRKAVAYAQVYADGSPELATRLGAIARDLLSAPRAEPPAIEPARRRGRPRKVDATLFSSTTSSFSPSSSGELRSSEHADRDATDDAGDESTEHAAE